MKQITLYKSWLDLDKYQFKVLVMIAALAQEKRGFRGKLKDMCDFLHMTHRENIKKAIYELQDKGLINASLDGYTWTISLTEIAEDSDENSITIDLDNFTAIQNYKAADPQNYVAWENILKVLVYLCADKREVKRYDEIAKALGITETTAKRAVRALVNIEFNDISVKRKLAWFKTNDGDFKVIGNKYEVGYKFE